MECMVRTYLDEEIPNEYAYIITGVLGTKLTMNENNSDKNNVRLPEYFYKAFCYVSGSTSYSFVYIQVNENDQTSRIGFSLVMSSSQNKLLYLLLWQKMSFKIVH